MAFPNIKEHHLGQKPKLSVKIFKKTKGSLEIKTPAT
jgi:hypothetical protein